MHEHNIVPHNTLFYVQIIKLISINTCHRRYRAVRLSSSRTERGNWMFLQICLYVHTSWIIFRIINSKKIWRSRIYLINFFGVLAPVTTLFAHPIWIGIFTHLHLRCAFRSVLIYVRVVINLVTNRIDKRLAFVHKCSLNNATQMTAVAERLVRDLTCTWVCVFGSRS